MPFSRPWARRLAEELLSRTAQRLRRTKAGSFAVDCARAGRAVVHGFLGERISLRASALTYITMLSLVPALAVAFAIVHLLGQEGLRRSVHEFIFTNLAPGTREQVGSYLDEFIARASAGAMGGLGGLFLLASALSLLHHIEASLNEIWGVRKARPLGQRLLIYWGILTLGPVVLAVSLLASSSLGRLLSGSGLLPPALAAALPLAATVLLLTFLYLATPNAPVSFRAALGGALTAGAAWELAKRAYGLYASRSFQYSAVYGSLGAIPLFLLWVYVSWLLVLSGARLAYALQHAARASAAARWEAARDREILCARVALAAVDGFLRGAPPPVAQELAREIGLEASPVIDVMERLTKRGLFAQAENGGLVPARAPERISLLEVRRAAQGDPRALAAKASPDQALGALCELFSQADRAGDEVLEQLSLATLAGELTAAASARPART